MTSTGPRIVGAEGLHAREIAALNKQRSLGWNLLAVATAPTVIGWRYFRGKAQALATSTGQASVGAKSEHAVVDALRAMPDVAVVLSGLHLSTYSKEDIDQTVLLKSGAVAIVETKTRMGYVRVDGGVLVSGKDKKPFHGDPLGQVTRNATNVASAIEGHLVGPVHRIICVAPAPNREVLDYQDEPGRTPIRICTAKTLAAALADLTPTVDSGQVRAAEQTLKRASRSNRR